MTSETRSFDEFRINYENREALGITDFEFYPYLKRRMKKYTLGSFRGKHIAKNFDCLLTLDEELEYPLAKNDSKISETRLWSLFCSKQWWTKTDLLKG